MKSFQAEWNHDTPVTTKLSDGTLDLQFVKNDVWLVVSKGHETKEEAALAVWDAVAENARWGDTTGRSTYRIVQVVTTVLAMVEGL